ncbi:hypothetical protein Cadr_000017514 [Camelus dromedarius]|uniref:Uncharacterized protein n=1 Tax=Camelus dromedarius TaxID=9838 RepID=A0A5N4DG72_CAMDR|nr:hypothetical protein Cadr_000017514 [Camelus dromedarius]
MVPELHLLTPNPVPLPKVLSCDNPGREVLTLSRRVGRRVGGSGRDGLSSRPQSKGNHRQRNSSTEMIGDCRGQHRMAKDIRSSWFKAAGLPWPLNKGASWRSWALPLYSVPWRQLGLHVASNRDACHCAFSVNLQLPPKCDTGALKAANRLKMASQVLADWAKLRAELGGLWCLWFCRVSPGAAWLPEKGQVGAGVKNRIQPPSSWLTAHREGRGHVLPTSAATVAQGRPSWWSPAQDAVGRWGSGWVFTGWKPDRSCDIQGSRGEDGDIVQGLWLGGMQGQDWVTDFPHLGSSERSGKMAVLTEGRGAVGASLAVPERGLPSLRSLPHTGLGGQSCVPHLDRCLGRDDLPAQPQRLGARSLPPLPASLPEPCLPFRVCLKGHVSPPTAPSLTRPDPLRCNAELTVAARGFWGLRSSRGAEPPPSVPPAHQAHQDQGQRQAQQRGGAEEQRGKRQRGLRLDLGRRPGAHRLLRLQRRRLLEATGREGRGQKRGTKGEGKVEGGEAGPGRGGTARRTQGGRGVKRRDGEGHAALAGPHPIPRPHTPVNQVTSQVLGQVEAMPETLAGWRPLRPSGRLLPGLGSGVRRRLQATQLRTSTHCVGAGPSLPLRPLAPRLMLPKPMLPLHTRLRLSLTSAVPPGGNREGPPPTPWPRPPDYWGPGPQPPRPSICGSSIQPVNHHPQTTTGRAAEAQTRACSRQQRTGLLIRTQTSGWPPLPLSQVIPTRHLPPPASSGEPSCPSQAELVSSSNTQQYQARPSPWRGQEGFLEEMVRRCLLDGERAKGVPSVTKGLEAKYEGQRVLGPEGWAGALRHWGAMQGFKLGVSKSDLPVSEEPLAGGWGWGGLQRVSRRETQISRRRDRLTDRPRPNRHCPYSSMFGEAPPVSHPGLSDRHTSPLNLPWHLLWQRASAWSSGLVPQALRVGGAQRKDREGLRGRSKGKCMERGKGKLALGTDMATASGDAAEGGRLRLQMGRVRPQPQAWGKEGSELLWGWRLDRATRAARRLAPWSRVREQASRCLGGEGDATEFLVPGTRELTQNPESAGLEEPWPTASLSPCSRASNSVAGRRSGSGVVGVGVGVGVWSLERSRGRESPPMGQRGGGKARRLGRSLQPITSGAVTCNLSPAVPLVRTRHLLTCVPDIQAMLAGFWETAGGTSPWERVGPGLGSFTRATSARAAPGLSPGGRSDSGLQPAGESQSCTLATLKEKRSYSLDTLTGCLRRLSRHRGRHVQVLDSRQTFPLVPPEQRRRMTQHVRGGLDGACVQPAMKCGLCPSCLRDKVGEVRKPCWTSLIPRGIDTQPPRSGCESALRPGMHAGPHGVNCPGGLSLTPQPWPWEGFDVGPRDTGTGWERQEDQHKILVRPESPAIQGQVMPFHAAVIKSLPRLTQAPFASPLSSTPRGCWPEQPQQFSWPDPRLGDVRPLCEPHSQREWSPHFLGGQACWCARWMEAIRPGWGRGGGAGNLPRATPTSGIIQGTTQEGQGCCWLWAPAGFGPCVSAQADSMEGHGLGKGPVRSWNRGTEVQVIPEDAQGPVQQLGRWQKMLSACLALGPACHPHPLPQPCGGGTSQAAPRPLSAPIPTIQHLWADDTGGGVGVRSSKKRTNPALQGCDSLRPGIHRMLASSQGSPDVTEGPKEGYLLSRSGALGTAHPLSLPELIWGERAEQPTTLSPSASPSVCERFFHNDSLPVPLGEGLRQQVSSGKGPLVLESCQVGQTQQGGGAAVAGLYLKTIPRSPHPPHPWAQPAHPRGHRLCGGGHFGFSEPHKNLKRSRLRPRSHCMLAADSKSVGLKGRVLSHCITSPLHGPRLPLLLLTEGWRHRCHAAEPSPRREALPPGQGWDTSNWGQDACFLGPGLNGCPQPGGLRAQKNLLDVLSTRWGPKYPTLLCALGEHGCGSSQAQLKGTSPRSLRLPIHSDLQPRGWCLPSVIAFKVPTLKQPTTASPVSLHPPQHPAPILSSTGHKDCRPEDGRQPFRGCSALLCRAPAKLAGAGSSDSIVLPQLLEGSQVLGWRIAPCWLAERGGVWEGPPPSQNRQAGCAHTTLGHQAPKTYPTLHLPSTWPCKAPPFMAQAPEGLKTMLVSRSRRSLEKAGLLDLCRSCPSPETNAHLDAHHQPLPLTRTHPQPQHRSWPLFPNTKGVLGQPLPRPTPSSSQCSYPAHRPPLHGVSCAKGTPTGGNGTLRDCPSKWLLSLARVHHFCVPSSGSAQLALPPISYVSVGTPLMPTEMRKHCHPHRHEALRTSGDVRTELESPKLRFSAGPGDCLEASQAGALGQDWKDPKERKAGPTLMTPAPSFQVGPSSVKAVSCGCHDDVKAGALRCCHCPGHQAGMALRPEDGGQGTSRILRPLPPGLRSPQLLCDCPATGEQPEPRPASGFHLCHCTQSSQRSKQATTRSCKNSEARMWGQIGSPTPPARFLIVPSQSGREAGVPPAGPPTRCARPAGEGGICPQGAACQTLACSPATASECLLSQAPSCGDRQPRGLVALTVLLSRDSRFRAETPGTWPAQICSMRTRRCAMVVRKPSTCRGRAEKSGEAACSPYSGQFRGLPERGWGLDGGTAIVNCPEAHSEQGLVSTNAWEHRFQRLQRLPYQQPEKDTHRDGKEGWTEGGLTGDREALSTNSSHVRAFEGLVGPEELWDWAGQDHPRARSIPSSSCSLSNWGGGITNTSHPSQRPGTSSPPALTPPFF